MEGGYAMKISLVGMGFKILSIFLTIWVGIITYLVLFLVDDKNIFISLFILLVFAFCIFSLYIAFTYKIILYDNHMIVQVPFKKIIEYKDVKKIYCTDDQVESSIYIDLKDSKIRVTGYMVLFNKKKRYQKTEKITGVIIKFLELKYPNME